MELMHHPQAQGLREQRPATLAGTDFRAYLQAELVRRCKANPKYSLRAFARTLAVEPSFLSKILNRKRVITVATIERFGARLGLGPAELQGFRNVVAARGRGDAVDAISFQQVTLDHFQLIADWYHYAILELVTVKGFKADVRWVASRLGITPSEAADAVERLERLGFLDTSIPGRWVNVSGNNTTVGTEFTAAALRRLQRHVLELGIDALENVAPERRDQTSMTVAIDTKLLPEARERIARFRRELTKFLQKSGSWDEVYHLGISLYPVTRQD